MSDVNRAVFLSYASQDAEAARTICEALRAAGVEVWFDQSELRGGDAWDAKIRKQIKECALFVPVISANTNARPEGYFRLEWLLAVERMRLMADDHPFLFPIAIGDISEGPARVPEKFREVQWTRIRLDETPAEMATRIARLLASGATGAPVVAPGEVSNDAKVASAKRRWGRRWWMVFPVVGILTGLGFAVVPLWNAFRRPEPGGPMPAQAAPMSEARRLVARAQTVFENGDLINRETYVLTEALLKKAEELDVTDAEAWALHAQVSWWMYTFAFDASAERKEAMRLQAERAVKLAPDSVSAQLAYATMLLEVGGNTDQAEHILNSLAAKHPDNWRVLHGLGLLHRRNGRIDQSIEILQRARRLSDEHQAVIGDLLTRLVMAGRYAEAEAVVAECLPRKSNGRALEFDVRLKLNWRGDAAAAATALERLPAWMLNEDRGAQCAAQVWMWNRQPTKGLVALAAFPRDYIRHARFTGPRAAVTAWLHEQAANSQAAQADWKLALRVADRELAIAPTNSEALHWKAWALARLGDRAAAELIWRELVERNVDSFLWNESTVGLVALGLVVGKTDWALAELEKIFSESTRKTFGTFVATRAVLDLNPAFDSVRTDPRFQRIRAAAPAPAPGPANVTQSGSPAAADAKSVVVLPFANLSGDPEQEYFSDGLTEEILNALARERDLRVTGRTSAFSFKGKNASAAEIAQTLNVAQLVEGSVRKAGKRVRISIQLTRASDGFSEALPTVERELTDIFALQDEVARLVVEKLTRRNTTAAPVAVLTKNPEAYDAYLRGRVLQTGSTRLSMQAIALYERSLELDPSFALAWARLAEARLRSFTSQYLRSTELVDTARVAFEKALALQPNMPEALIVRARWAHVVKGDGASADRDLALAATLQPPTAELRLAQALLAWDRGAQSECLRLLDEAIALDPGNRDLRNLAGIRFHLAGKVFAADQHFLRATEVQGFEGSPPFGNRIGLRRDWRGVEAALRLLERASPGHQAVALWRADLLLQLGRVREARAILEQFTEPPQLESDAMVMADAATSARALLLMNAAGWTDAARRHAIELRRVAQEQLAKGNQGDRVWHALIRAQTVLGEKEAALTALAKWKALVDHADEVHVGSAYMYYRLASGLYASLGRLDEEISLLRQRIRKGLYWGYSLRTMPDMAPLRDDPRFQEIVRLEEAWAQRQPDPVDL